MHQKESNKNLPFSLNTYACAPSYTKESLFFNMILNTEYENTKENCLIFFKNYSKNIILSKRDLFKNIINELTLSHLSNNSINNNEDESLYLIRTCIKKYSRNNIINALFDYVSQNDNNENNIINMNCDNKKIENVENKEIRKEENKEIRN